MMVTNILQDRVINSTRRSERENDIIFSKLDAAGVGSLQAFRKIYGPVIKGAK